MPSKTATVRVRNMPHELRRRLEARAASEGLSLSNYILSILRTAIGRPTRQEVLDRIRAGVPKRVWPSPAQLIREERDSR